MEKYIKPAIETIEIDAEQSLLKDSQVSINQTPLADDEYFE